MAILYYQIKSDIYSDFRVTRNPRLPPSVSFIKGLRILDPLPRPMPFEVNYPDQPPHLVGNTIAVISEQLRQALQSLAVDNFEAFPATLRNPTTGAEWTDYWALNVLGLVAAAHAFLGKPTLTDSTQSALRHFAAAALADANASWKKSQYPSLIENALRQLIAVSPDYQTC